MWLATSNHKICLTITSALSLIVNATFHCISITISSRFFPNGQRDHKHGKDLFKFFLKSGTIRPLFYYSFFSKTNLREHQTRIVGVEGKFADHLTTTTALLCNFFFSSSNLPVIIFRKKKKYAEKRIRRTDSSASLHLPQMIANAAMRRRRGLESIRPTSWSKIVFLELLSFWPRTRCHKQILL